jgi:DNA-binding response OmpR family regulator
MSVHILMVDDDELLRRSLALNLEEAGYQTSTAATAELAFQIVERDRPDLILLDIGLPGMDGLDALRKFQLPDSDGNEPGIPIIFSPPGGANWTRHWGLNWAPMIISPSRLI